MKVMFFGSCSLGPYFIMNYLKQHGHEVQGCYLGLDDIVMGEPSKPFSPPISIEAVCDFNPDIIGISLDTTNFSRAEKIVKSLKERLPNTLVGLGGIHPTVRAQHSIEMPQVDFICEGEGELTMLELANKLENKEDYYDVQGLWFNKPDGSIVKNEIRPWHQNLDDFQIDRYAVDFSGIFTGMGCKGRCTFCSTPKIMFEMGVGKYYRKRSVDSILDEVGHLFKARLKRIIPNFKIRGFKRLKQTFWDDIFEPISIKDDSFLINKPWLLEFCEKFKKRFWYLTFACLGRADELDEEMTKALAQAGCVRLVIGFEHGDEELRNKILYKKCTDKQLRNCVKYMNKYGITSNGQWMIGFPGETVQQALKTLKLAAEIDDMPHIHIAQAYPGTVMFDMAVKQGRITQDYVAEEGTYEGFLFHSGPEADALRMIYNLFPIARVKIPENIEVLGRFQDHVGSMVTENVCRGFELNENMEVDQEEEEETKRRSLAYRRKTNSKKIPLQNTG